MYVIAVTKTNLLLLVIHHLEAIGHLVFFIPVNFHPVLCYIIVMFLLGAFNNTNVNSWELYNYVFGQSSVLSLGHS